MKLLLDENLSFRIAPSLQDVFPGTTQVRLVGLERADDRAIWQFAKKNEFVIVTKDDDFHGLLSMLGYPPKVIHFRTGNTANQAVTDALRHNADEIITAILNPKIGFIEIC